MWRSRVFWRLFGAYGLLLVSAIAILGLVVTSRARERETQHIEQRLRGQALLLSELVGELGAGEDRLQAGMPALRERTGARVTLIADDGRVLADSDQDPQRMNNHADRPEIIGARGQGFGRATRPSESLGEPFLYVALRADRPGRVAFVRVALPLAGVEHELAGLRRVVWTTAGVTGLAALALAYLMARQTASPLHELTKAAELIAAGNYGGRVYGVAVEEVGPLARSFNRMSKRLADQFSQLEEERQLLRAVLGGMIEGVVAVDAEQRILFANERAVSLLGFAAPAFTGRKFWEVVRRRPLQEVITRALGSAEPVEEEVRWSDSPARSLTVHATRLPGAPTRGAVLVLHDTTELRQLERLRQDFVANVSHELKTPLSVIAGCVETLLDGAVDDPQHRGPFLERIAHQADRLHALILDLLSLARIEAGTEVFSFQSVSVAEAVQACLERHRARAEGKSQHLELAPENAARPDGAAVWADEEAVSQILDNLVDNAIKYTPAGGNIRVGWKREENAVCLEVADTGIGIAEKDLPRIFERFYRVDKARSRELGGTGLGLSIVKHLAQAMHGGVAAASQVGGGTQFFVRLPKASAD